MTAQEFRLQVPRHADAGQRRNLGRVDGGDANPLIGIVRANVQLRECASKVSPSMMLYTSPQSMSILFFLLSHAELPSTVRQVVEVIAGGAVPVRAEYFRFGPFTTRISVLRPSGQGT
jgi:hypothetical protein